MSSIVHTQTIGEGVLERRWTCQSSIKAIKMIVDLLHEPSLARSTYLVSSTSSDANLAFRAIHLRYTKRLMIPTPTMKTMQKTRITPGFSLAQLRRLARWWICDSRSAIAAIVCRRSCQFLLDHELNRPTYGSAGVKLRTRRQNNDCRSLSG